MSSYDRGTRQLRNRRPDLHDFRVQPHGHTAPWDGGVVSVDVLAGGSSSGGGGSGGSGIASVTDGSTTVAGPSTLDFTSGATVTDLGGGVAGVAISGGSPTGPAGGDLSGAYPNPSVAQISGSPVGPITSPAVADRLRWSGSAWVNSALVWRPAMVLDPASGNYLPVVTGGGDAVMVEA